jgi:hypothetical protein
LVDEEDELGGGVLELVDDQVELDVVGGGGGGGAEVEVGAGASPSKSHEQ